jgi:peptide/nickel transport system ATP-binding protein/oligopeptide transport system ATP-binding protein
MAIDMPLQSPQAGASGPLLEIRGLKTSFYLKRGTVPAVDEVNLTVGRGEILGLVGESGCGKTMTSLSILRLVAQPGRIEAGEVRLDGENLLALSAEKMRKVRGRDISMIFQEPMTSLNPVHRVGQQVAEALLVHEPGLGAKSAKAKVVELFGHVGIPEPESRYTAFPHQLSGGMRQRVMIAMALACRPKLILADEPTTALDVTIEAQILRLMKKLQSETGASILLISHNLGIIAEICDRVAVMYAGKIVEECEVFGLFDKPLHPYTVGLLESLPRGGSARSPGSRMRSIQGTVPDMSHLPAGCRFHPRCPEATELCRARMPELLEAETGHLVRCWNRVGKDGAGRGAAAQGGRV